MIIHNQHINHAIYAPLVGSSSILLAERQGFEPWEGVTLNGFQDRRFKPLSHLSELIELNWKYTTLRTSIKKKIALVII
jgi:hypothetical protein